jgi:hypothetical protein
MSIPGRNSTAVILVRTGFLVVLVLVNVSGFRPVLARGWHDQLGKSVIAYAILAHERHMRISRQDGSLWPGSPAALGHITR